MEEKQASSFYLSVVASDKEFYGGQCRFLVVPIEDGEKAVMPHHEDMIIAVSVGGMRITKPDGTVIFAVVGNGFIQILNNRVKVLVDTAELPEEIDKRRAEEAKERAEEMLRQKQSIQEHHRTEAALARALTRLRLADKYGTMS